MSEADLRRVLEIEEDLYEFPWTLGNFRDSLRAGYGCWVVRDGRQLIAYAVLMLAAGEGHLLNLSVAAQAQRRGHGRSLLNDVVEAARSAMRRSCSSKSGRRTRWDSAFIPLWLPAGRSAARLLSCASRPRGRPGSGVGPVSGRSERYLEEMGLAPVWRLRGRREVRPTFPRGSSGKYGSGCGVRERRQSPARALVEGAPPA